MYQSTQPDHIVRALESKKYAYPPPALLYGAVILLTFSVGVAAFYIGQQQGKTVSVQNQIAAMPLDAVDTQAEEITPPTDSASSIGKALETPTQEPTEEPTPTPESVVLTASYCPVSFTLPKGQIVESESTYRWSITSDSYTNRYYLVPRAEEVNGREVYLSLLDTNRQSGNQMLFIHVQCQDNKNAWNMNDYKTYIQRADGMYDVSISTVKKWGRDVYTFVYRSGDYRQNTYTFSTPNTLFAIYYSGSSNSELEALGREVLDSITFK